VRVACLRPESRRGSLLNSAGFSFDLTNRTKAIVRTSRPSLLFVLVWDLERFCYMNRTDPLFGLAEAGAVLT